MAHVEKFKRAAVGNMLHHYRRDREAVLSRDNIDRNRTRFNYVLGQEKDLSAEISHCLDVHNANGRLVREDAVVMADWVVTLPQDCPVEKSGEFFQAVFEFVQGRYGSENVPVGYVHMDETTPHAHIPVLPFDREKGRFRASNILTRKDLNAFHSELSEHVERSLGFHVSVQLSEETKKNRAVKYTSLDEFQRASDALREIQQQEQEALARLERLRREEQRAEAENRELEPVVAAVERYEGENRSGKAAIVAEVCGYLERANRALVETVRQMMAEIRERLFGYLSSVEESAMLAVPAPIVRQSVPGARRQAGRSVARDSERARDTARGRSAMPNRDRRRGGEAR